MEIKLTETEVRVLGALIEKDITTPEYYPLSLNALVNACNQKTNRDPVLHLDEDAVRDALEGLPGIGDAEVVGCGLGRFEVAVVPGEAFGPSGYLRMSYALSDADLAEGVTRMQKLLAEAR